MDWSKKNFTFLALMTSLDKLWELSPVLTQSSSAEPPPWCKADAQNTEQSISSELVTGLHFICWSSTLQCMFCPFGLLRVLLVISTVVSLWATQVTEVNVVYILPFLWFQGFYNPFESCAVSGRRPMGDSVPGDPAHLNPVLSSRLWIPFLGKCTCKLTSV